MRDRPQLSPTTALNGIHGSSGWRCQHSQPHPGRTVQNPALRAKPGHASSMRPPSFSSRSIQPPGKSSSIRPPRSGQSAPPNHSLRLSRRPSAPWVCLLIIAIVVVAGAVVHLRGSAGSHAALDRRSAEDDAAQPSPSDSASSSFPAAGTPTSSTAASPVTDDPWAEQWRLETGVATAWKPGGDWGFLSNGNHIAVYDDNHKGATPSRSTGWSTVGR